MKNKWYYLVTILVAVLGLITLAFEKGEDVDHTWVYVNPMDDDAQLVSIVPREHEVEFNHFSIPFSGKSFVAFRQALAFKESQGKYDLVNKFGYAGKYQFGKSALNAVGIYNRKEFLNSPLLQEEAFKALLSINKHLLQEEIDTYSGRVINGTEISESGILASAHLLGAHAVKKYLKSGGKHKARDGFGTNIKTYMSKFGGYDTSIIKPNPNAKATANLVKKPKK